MGTRTKLFYASDPEVENLYVAVTRQEHVVGLEISVHKILGVRGGQDVENLIDETEHFERIQATFVSGPSLFQRFTFKQLHDEKNAAVMLVVIEDAYRAGMLHLVGQVAFTKGARADLGVRGQRAVQYLDRNTASVSVGGRVDRCHSADAEKAIETPFGLDNSAHARLRLAGYLEFREKASKSGSRIAGECADASCEVLEFRRPPRLVNFPQPREICPLSLRAAGDALVEQKLCNHRGGGSACLALVDVVLDSSARVVRDITLDERNQRGLAKTRHSRPRITERHAVRTGPAV